MSAVLARVGAWLVEPAPLDASRVEASASRAGVAAPASRSLVTRADSVDDVRADVAMARAAAAARSAEVAVLAAPADVHPVAAALALRLTRGVAAVGLWTGDASLVAARGALPPTPAARRLAARLTARDLPARAAGRLVTTTLSGDEATAAAAAGRLFGAVVDAPVVLAAGGPRGEAWDGLLARCDLVAVHARDDALAELALTRLAEQGAHAVRIGAPRGAAAGRLACAGFAVPGTLDGLADAVRAVAR